MLQPSSSQTSPEAGPKRRESDSGTADAHAPEHAASSVPSTDVRLRCLAELYDAKVTERDGRSGLLANEGFVPWNDGRQKTPSQRLDTPDLADLFVPAYRREAPQKVTLVDHDPGRVRVEALLRQAYGHNAASVQRELVPVPLRRNTVSVHRRALPAFRAVFLELEKIASTDPAAARFVDTLGGTYNDRNIAGTHRKSAHAFGIAIDLNPALAQYHQNLPGGAWRTPVPEAIVKAFESQGFVWGGRWYHDDTMHFEYRPELFDARCTGPDDGGPP
jgi:hypothetical protein